MKRGRGEKIASKKRAAAAAIATSDAIAACAAADAVTADADPAAAATAVAAATAAADKAAAANAATAKDMECGRAVRKAVPQEFKALVRRESSLSVMVGKPVKVKESPRYSKIYKIHEESAFEEYKSRWEILSPKKMDIMDMAWYHQIKRGFICPVDLLCFHRWVSVAGLDSAGDNTLVERLKVKFKELLVAAFTVARLKVSCLMEVKALVHLVPLGCMMRISLYHKLSSEIKSLIVPFVEGCPRLDLVGLKTDSVRKLDCSEEADIVTAVGRFVESCSEELLKKLNQEDDAEGKLSVEEAIDWSKEELQLEAWKKLHLNVKYSYLQMAYDKQIERRVLRSHDLLSLEKFLKLTADQEELKLVKLVSQKPWGPSNQVTSHLRSKFEEMVKVARGGAFVVIDSVKVALKNRSWLQAANSVLSQSSMLGMPKFRRSCWLVESM